MELMDIIDAGKVRICVSSTRVSGRDFVDIRAYVTDLSGLLKPTKTGMLIPVEKCMEVMAAAERACAKALQSEPAFVYYFKEHVEEKTLPRVVHIRQTSPTAREAVRRTPDEYGAESGAGYIFKCKSYELVNSSYKFAPTKPFAVWSTTANKWVRWEKRVR